MLRNASHLSVTSVHDGTKEGSLLQSPRTSVSSSVKNRIHACLVVAGKIGNGVGEELGAGHVLPADSYSVSFFSVYLPPH